VPLFPFLNVSTPLHFGAVFFFPVFSCLAISASAVVPHEGGSQTWLCVCAFKSMNYEAHPSTRSSDVYQDRAAERRRIVGSDCHTHEPAAEPASVHRYHNDDVAVVKFDLNRQISSSCLVWPQEL